MHQLYDMRKSVLKAIGLGRNRRSDALSFLPGSIIFLLMTWLSPPGYAYALSSRKKVPDFSRRAAGRFDFNVKKAAVVFGDYPVNKRQRNIGVIAVKKLKLKGLNQPKLTVQGEVTDRAGTPLVGVTIKVKGTDQGVVSDSKGHFTMVVPEDAILEVSYIGYGSKEVPLNGRASLQVVLGLSNSSLDEVVVVGYGTQRKRDLTGAVSQVKPAALTAVSTGNVANALQGRMSGVSVSTDNQPGNPPKIRVRGARSISASNNPLVVVDGFPLVDADLSDINPDNIQSIQVLKDASATAIYGSRGANGVVMVTTKKGIAGQNNVSVEAYYGVQSPARKVKMLQRDDFVDFINAAYMNQTGKPVYTDANPAPDDNTDWQDVLFGSPSYVKSLTLTFDGGNEKTRYMLSGGYYGQDGLLPKSGFKKVSFHTNIEHRVSDWLKIGTHIQVNRSVSDKENQDLSVAYGIQQRNLKERTIMDPFSPDVPNLINIFRFGWPTFPVRNADGSYFYGKEDPDVGGYIESYWNPIADANNITNRTTGDVMFGNVYGEITFLDHFTFRSTFNADLSRTKYYYFKKTSKYASSNEGSQSYSQGNTIISENMLTYQNAWGDHSLKINGVYSYQSHDYSSLEVAGSGFPTDLTGANNVGLISNLNTPSSDRYASKLMSWTSRINYAYKDRYLLTLTGRYDGSSRFGKNNKWGFFPSVGVAWRVSDETFMDNLKVVSNLKLRASYGVTGNQEIGNYKSLATLSQVNYISGDDQLILGFDEELGNPDLRWEKTAQSNIGLDLGLWDDRVLMTADYFKMDTRDLLYDVPIPTTSGYSSVLQNIGEVQNTGFEMGLNVKVVDTKDFSWDVNGNFTTYKNKVVSLYGDVDKIKAAEKDGLIRYLEVGQPINGLWARKSGGIIKDEAEAEAIKAVQPLAQPGGERYVDENGDGTIDEDDYVLIGTTDPDFYYGISTGVRYKHLSLYIAGQGASGVASASTTYLIMGDYQLQNRNYIPSQYAYDRMWREDNHSGTFPRPGAKNLYYSDKSNGNRNYFIIKNIQLNYELGSLFKDKELLKDATVYLNAQNYISFANFRGYNPENGDILYPLAKSIRLGVNLKF